MADKKTPGLPFEADDPSERELWQALGDVEAEGPSPGLRQGFYRKLADASRPSVVARLREVFGFSGNVGWVTAAASLVIGIGAGVMMSGGAGNDAGSRLAALEQNVTLLNRQLILDRLDNDTPSKRLRGVIDAASVASQDEEIARALLVRATSDRVSSVRSAAIDALGPSINTPAVGEQLMPVLQQAGSPIVQLALVDLLLRYGNGEQLDLLLSLARSGQLYPDLKDYVINALEGETA